MNTDLRDFLARFAGVVLMTLMPIAFTTFISVPLNLNHHPEEPPRNASTPLPQHMT